MMFIYKKNGCITLQECVKEQECAKYRLIICILVKVVNDFERCIRLGGNI